MRKKMNIFFKQNGLRPLLGVTPVLFGKGKAVEVLNWLDKFTDGNGPKGSTISGWCFVDEVDAVSAHFLVLMHRVLSCLRLSCMGISTTFIQRIKLDRDGVNTINQPAPKEAAVAARFQGHFVRVDLTKGLSEPCADRIIEIIRRRPLLRGDQTSNSKVKPKELKDDGSSSSSSEEEGDSDIDSNEE